MLSALPKVSARRRGWTRGIIVRGGGFIEFCRVTVGAPRWKGTGEADGGPIEHGVVLPKGGRAVNGQVRAVYPWAEAARLPSGHRYAMRSGPARTLALPRLGVRGVGNSSLDKVGGFWSTLRRDSREPTSASFTNGIMKASPGSIFSLAVVLVVAEWLTQPVAAASFYFTGSLGTGRAFHTATLLPNGKVLAAGGFNGGGYLSGAELYEPTTGIWMATGTMITARKYHTGTMLPDGKVLLAGGEGSASPFRLSSADCIIPRREPGRGPDRWQSPATFTRRRYC